MIHIQYRRMMFWNFLFLQFNPPKCRESEIPTNLHKHCNCNSIQFNIYTYIIPTVYQAVCNTLGPRNIMMSKTERVLVP